MTRAVILAGGRGTRLRPYTVALPKPLMPIGEWPILEIIIKQLARHGFNHVTLAVNHQADILRAYFGDGAKWNVKIDYSLETQALGTVGPLRLIADLPENFLVMNGDILTDLDFGAFIRRHQQQARAFTVSAAAREQKIDYGVLKVNEDSRLCGFEEKPVIPYLVSMGIYCLHSKVLNEIPVNQPFGFDQLILSRLSTNRSVVVEPHPGYWLDIGRPDDYERAVDDWPLLRQELGF
jgi:NDP-mannose synthase